jgi:hypothetical protein
MLFGMASDVTMVSYSSRSLFISMMAHIKMGGSWLKREADDNP